MYQFNESYKSTFGRSETTVANHKYYRKNQKLRKLTTRYEKKFQSRTHEERTTSK